MDNMPLNSARLASKWHCLDRRWVWWLVGVAIAIVWIIQHNRSGAPPLSLANSVSISFSSTDPAKPDHIYEFGNDEHDGIVVLNSMFVPRADKRLSLNVPKLTRYSIRYLPSGGLFGSTQAIGVWEANGGLVWSQGSGVFQVNGDLDAFLDALPARHAVRLLLSRNRKEQEEGRRLKQLNGDDFVDALLKVCSSENATLRQFGLRNLSFLISESIPVFEFSRWNVTPQPRRAVAVAKANDVRRVTLQVLKTALADRYHDEKSGRFETILFACDCLAETGDQATANELAGLLGDEANLYGWGKIMDCLEAIYGLPSSYEKRSMCGNSSQAEFAAFAKQQNLSRRSGRDKLLKWHMDHGSDNRAVQLDAVLTEWHYQLLALGNQRGFSEAYSPVPDKQFLPLLRTGHELVPAIEKQKRRSADLVEQGALEFIKACITGTCDDAIVNQLLNGDMRQQILACNIIGAARRTDWQSQLDQFQYTPLPKDNPGVFHDAFALRSAATAALLMGDAPQAFTLVKSAHDGGYENTQSTQAVKYFTPSAAK